ncbi:MAG: ABC transporter permease subunit [Candidatus Thermoplasmatota archaeon]|nr:ABC transporter permease subunit [Candidatus Thermoplasmatota archaeon]
MKRYLEEKIFKFLMLLSMAIIASSLFLIIGITILKGGVVMVQKPQVIVTAPGPRYLLGGEGGFLHAILGSIYMVLPATAFASIMAFGIAIFLQSDYSSQRVSESVRTFLDALWGTPSIVYGIFVLTILIYLHQRASLLAGIFALALLELPIIARYADEAVQSVLLDVKEVAYSMGTTRWETSKIVGRHALPGIAAGVLMGLGRGMGDAASIIFTCGASSVMPSGLFQTATALPVMIFQQASSCYPSVREQAYAAAFVLMAIVLLLNIASRILVGHFSTYISGGKK